MLTLEVDVREKHIESGASGSGTSCPIALAIQEEIGGFVMVDSTAVFVLDGDVSLRADMPPTASRFVLDFDDNNVVRPFKFSLDFEEAGTFYDFTSNGEVE